MDNYRYVKSWYFFTIVLLWSATWTFNFMNDAKDRKELNQRIDDVEWEISQDRLQADNKEKLASCEKLGGEFSSRTENDLELEKAEKREVLSESEGHIYFTFSDDWTRTEAECVIAGKVYKPAKGWTLGDWETTITK